MSNIELLAPAGDLEKLKIAYLYGADAVYCSLKQLGLRANANNFSWEELKEATIFAHHLKKKIYVTVNIIFHEKERKLVEQQLLKLDEIGIDAIIASDLLVIRKCQELHVSYDVHVSTQASILNGEAGLFYKKYGVTRLVLAREANIEDIKKIKEQTNLELECFIHGAMCTSFSGRCVLSNYCTKRDANRGGCAQICRWTFAYPKTEQVFSMTPKDLNLIEYIDQMIQAGVNSFKIEGRMRGIYYVATVVLAYRRMIDKIIKKDLNPKEIEYYLQVLNRCANRESAPQFIEHLPGRKEQYFLGRQEVSNQDFLGIVLDYDEQTHFVTLEQRNYFKVGDEVQFFGPNHETISHQITEIINEENEKISIANHPGMIVKFKIHFKLEKYDMMRIKLFDKHTFL